MKLKKTSCTIFALSAITGIAYAQSSVTLYGVADSGFLFNNNEKGQRFYGLSSGTSSRFGLRGNEDLGGGLSAIFTLENGYSIGTGAASQGGLLFGRKAFVGLTSQNWGTLTAGRQYSVSNDFTQAFASGADWAASGLGYGTHAGDVDNVDSTSRIQNAVKYVSPNFSGLQFGAQYSFGGTPGSVTNKEVIDAGITYSNGPLKAGVGYDFIKNPNYATFGTQGNSSASGPNISNPIFSGYASAGAQQIIVAGGQYTLGPAVLGLIYSNTKFENLGATSLGATASLYNGGSATFNSIEANLKYNLTPALMLAGAYIYTRNSGADNTGSASYNQVNLGAVYALSKRTSLYAIAFYEAASGTDSTGKRAVADLAAFSAGGAAASSTSHQAAGIVGITHRF